MSAILFLIVAFPAFVLFLVAMGLFLAQPRQSPVQSRLQQWADWEKHQYVNDIPQTRKTKRRGILNADTNSPLLPGLRRILAQVKSPFNVVRFLLFILLVSAGGGLVVWFITQSWLQSALAAGVCGSVPCFLLWYKKQKYMKNFEGQLAPALDMLARSLWAGHTIQTGIRTIGQDFDDPIRSEFSKTAEAIDFGLPLPQALEELAERVDIADLRFFVTSVLVQRETGGNLADILARTADLIRQRLEFNDRIKALSAQGRLSAKVLFALPLLIAGAIYTINPGHVNVLFESDVGFKTFIASGMMMILGIIIVRRMVKIQV